MVSPLSSPLSGPCCLPCLSARYPQYSKIPNSKIWDEISLSSKKLAKCEFLNVLAHGGDSPLVVMCNLEGIPPFMAFNLPRIPLHVGMWC